MTLFDPDDPSWKLYREAERIRKLDEQIHRATQPSAAERVVEKLLREDEIHRRRERELRALMGPTDYAKTLEGMLAGYDSARAAEKLNSAALTSIAARLQADNERWTKLAGEVALQLGTSSLTSVLMETSFASFSGSAQNLMRAIQQGYLGAGSVEWASRMLGPLEGYSEYARDGLARSARQSAHDDRASIETGVALADAQISDASETLVAVAESSDETVAVEGEAAPYSDIENLPLPTDVNAFFRAQEADLRAAGITLSSDKSLSEVETFSVHGRRALRQREVFRLVVACNRAAQIRKAEPVFKLSDTLLVSASDLPWVYPQGSEALGKLVDLIYLTLYEASGKQKRFRPYIAEEEAKVVDAIIELRHKVFRHDMEQGAPKGLPFQWRDLSDSLAVLGAVDIPHSFEEHAQVHDAIVEQCIVFLETLLDGIKKRRT